MTATNESSLPIMAFEEVDPKALAELSARQQVSTIDIFQKFNLTVFSYYCYTARQNSCSRSCHSGFFIFFISLND
jgi:hypothetical protein